VGQQTQHTCGYPIWLEEVWNGIAFRMVTRDGKENSPTEGERIYQCPGCGETMMRQDFQGLLPSLRLTTAST